ncbi:GGDEF domain-containing protein [Marinobacterium sp. MBR-111]|uniref:GGDEF domain-containing protein n=1 Tax=Marinobacterium sp. MBR-111 TaxID=3156463 RepID=UPI003397B691
MAVSAVGYVMFQQYQGFSNLADREFDRAMAAAELTRDAEIIAAEVFEMMVGSRRSISAGSQRTENLAGLYRSARDRLQQLSSSADADRAANRELDRWQEPFFLSLGQLDQQLELEKQLQTEHLQLIDTLFILQQRLPLSDFDAQSPDQQRFISHALTALVAASSALSAERPGHVAQLERACEQALQKLALLPLEDEKLLELRRQLTEVLPEAFRSRGPLLKASRASLATARETRVLAQKLTGASFGYHLQLKASAQQAITDHQKLIRSSLFGLLLASLTLLAITFGAIMYIRRHIVLRINRLNAAMQAHLQGKQVPVPESGSDEISTMGASFAVFVDARRQAEQQLEQANMHLQKMNAELERLSTTDALTGIPNRRSFDQQLEHEWRRALRDGTRLAIVMADVDVFKRFNDTYGHQAGDDCLRQVAQVMSDQLKRSGDMIARYGGEEFIVLLPGLDLSHAKQLAEQLRAAVAGLRIPHAHGPTGHVSISLGVASNRPHLNMRVETLIHRADNALYAAKSSGRNRVQVAN